MKTKLLLLLSLMTGFLGFSQTAVYFRYDEAGNQRYRGTDATGKKTTEEIKEIPQLDEAGTVAAVKDPVMDEKSFWKQIRLYPVPVNEVLTIDWTEEADDLIESVALYQHSTVHWKFRQQNIPGLNRQLKVNMTGYEWGIYVLRFTLKDGSVFSRNITKR